MSIGSELEFWQALLLLSLVLLSIVYVFYFKIWLALATGSDFIFAAALSVAIASLTTPVPFDLAAATLIDRSSLPEALKSADAKVAEIESLPGELIDRALAKLGYESDPDEEPSLDPGPGPFESKIRPSVEGLVSSILRTASFFVSTLLLLMALALRSSTSTARALQKLSNRTETLEARLADSLDLGASDSKVEIPR